MNIVIPMAGRGSRFSGRVDSTPKILAPVHGQPMFLWAIKNLPQNYDDYICICLRDHIVTYGLDRKLRDALSKNVRIIALDEPTQGQACTVLTAKALINNDEPLIIHNADTYFECDMSPINDSAISGAIPYYESADPNMSFVRMDDSHTVLEVAEKTPISTHATVGLYYFSRGQSFVWAAERMIAHNVRVRDEFYVGPAYNELIARGDRIIGIRADAMWDLGTPEKVKHFERSLGYAHRS